MSLFSDALGTALSEISRAQGSLAIEHRTAADVATDLTGLAVFDAATVVVDLSTGALQRSSEPRLGVRLSDFADSPVVGDRVTVAGTAYKVVDIEKDGQGGASLHLHKL